MSSVDTGKADAADAAEPEKRYPAVASVSLWNYLQNTLCHDDPVLTFRQQITCQPTSLTDIGTMEGSLGRHLPVSHNRSVGM